ncbi:MAG: 23S rRNA (adenine(2503)-C(2))-methyltransferase RlmN [Candidatus Magnetomorum sp.]|nr:23S rRNA (adenine(2503)-C(2))-methyltransferase RlmN [Candidatus Magnetomorum sp.]
MPYMNIKSLSLNAFEQWLVNNSVKPYRATQIFKWIYKHQTDDFQAMTDISLSLRHKLAEHFIISSIIPAHVQTSTDGSKKYAFRLYDDHYVESVMIPERNHYTLCISSQVGCAQGCAFCLTAKQGFSRNLTHDEIVAQVQMVMRDLEGNNLPLKNIVLMGMGEPLANYQNVVKAIDILINSTYGFQFSTRKVTLSTCGIVPNMVKFSQDSPVQLAVSLNATDNQTRDMLMPINRTYPIEQLLSTCRNYPLRPGRRITIEYVLIKHINDGIKHAKKLCELLRGVYSKINLIPYNPHLKSKFERPDDSSIETFQNILIKNNYTAIIRQSKGSDISAACGQLSSEM